MILLAPIPVGLVGVEFEHAFGVLLGKPVRAAIFLVVNGLILLAGEKFRTRRSLAADAELADAAEPSGRRAAPRARVAGAEVPGATVAGAAVSPAAGGGGATLGGTAP